MNTREIKFRAWFNGQMYDDAYMNKYTLRHWIDSIKCPVMQFTGLLDKNGKEIYEDDIVEAWSAGSMGIFRIVWRQEGSPCYILFPAWQNGVMWSISAVGHYPGKAFISVDGNVERSDKLGYYDDGLTIIGNIHQTPELLQQ